VAFDLPQHRFDVFPYGKRTATDFINDLAALLSCKEGLENLRFRF
jgi:hypothetical protein